MKKDVSVEAKKAQFMVEKAMGDITRATRKVLMDYVSKLYVTSFAKAIAYLGLESEDAIDLLESMDYDTRRQVEAFAFMELKETKLPKIKAVDIIFNNFLFMKNLI